MHSDKMRGKVVGNFICVIIMNAVFAGIYGWFVFPNSNLDTWKVWEIRTAERETLTDLMWTANYPTDKDKMGFWAEGLCFYTPTIEDGIANKVPEFSFNPTNRNQRCITCEFHMGLFIWFVLSICNIVFTIFAVISFSKQSSGMTKFFNGLLSCNNCVGFVTFIILSCSRWSEAGRACSGEFMTDEAQP
jgi:hypothetical protein